MGNVLNMMGRGGASTGDATATANDILRGKTAYGADGKITGAIPLQEAKTVVPTTENQTAIPEGSYAAGAVTVAGDPNLKPENIVYGVSIFGVAGTYYAPPSIYGAEWDGSSNPAWTRTDAAANFVDPDPAVNNGDGRSPFDGISPWSGMEIVDDPTAGKLVSIPKYWYKWTRSGAAMKLQIANYAAEGFHVSPAHADRGDGKGERDYAYVGRYHCNTSYMSQAGSHPADSMTRAQARSSIHNLGSTYWQYDFAMYWTIMMLYLVEYANWNSQATIGHGCSPDGSWFNMGATDAMIYHTGTTAASRDIYGCCQYRYIEGLWDNVNDWCDGIYFSGTTIYCIKNPASFSDTSGGTNVGTRVTYGGYISGWSMPTTFGFEYALFPNELSGSETTCVCDYYTAKNYTSDGTVLYVGGSALRNQVFGAFYMSGYYDQSFANNSIGCRLQKLP